MVIIPYMNILGIGKKYLRFFVDTVKERWIVLQGGRRSGKSFAVYKWLHFLSSGEPVTTMVVAASFPALQLAMNDFARATGLTVTGSLMLGYSCTLSNGSRFLFRSFDSYEKAQGSTADYLYLEEALNIPEEIVSVLAMSVTNQIFAAYNPTKRAYIDKYIKEDKSNYLKTTFKDNPWLTEPQIQEFEEMKRRALLPTASVLEQYQYTTYYLGDFGSMSGKVFKVVNTCTDDEYAAVPAPELFSLDFGFTSNLQSDETALAGVKIFGSRLYLKEYLYSTALTNDEDLALAMADIGLDVYSQIVGDYGGMGATRIKALVTAGDYRWTDPRISSGFTVANARKAKIIDGLLRMLQYDIYVTGSSYNFRRELDDYELTDAQKPKSGLADHLVAAARYGVCSYSNFFDIPDGRPDEAES